MATFYFIFADHDEDYAIETLVNNLVTYMEEPEGVARAVRNMNKPGRTVEYCVAMVEVGE